MDDYTSCSQCGTRIEEAPDTPIEEQKRCPVCGSTARTYTVHIHEHVALGLKWGLKHKRPGHKKPVYESVFGDDLHRKSGQWNHLTREIDREYNHYREFIVSPTTGEVIRSVDEPLTEHTGRGSARKKQEGGDRDA